MERDVTVEVEETVTEERTVYFCDDCGSDFDRSELAEFESDEYEETLYFCETCLDGGQTVTKGLSRISEVYDMDSELRATLWFVGCYIAFSAFTITASSGGVVETLFAGIVGPLFYMALFLLVAGPIATLLWD